MLSSNSVVTCTSNRLAINYSSRLIIPQSGSELRNRILTGHWFIAKTIKDVNVEPDEEIHKAASEVLKHRCFCPHRSVEADLTFWACRYILVHQPRESLSLILFVTEPKSILLTTGQDSKLGFKLLNKNNNFYQ